MSKNQTEFTLSDIAQLAESFEIECKAAQGRDGRGEIPNSIWETYSAMANTSGGHIYLGIEETEAHAFICRGITDIGRIHKSLWDTLNNRNKISKNILTETDIRVLTIGHEQILDISIPRARRQDRPIHLLTSPFGNTYIRRHEGDYKADDEMVKRMLAESIDDSRDDAILTNFGINDLDMETVNAYRNRFSAHKPNHPWLNLPIESFLTKIGAMATNRHTGKTELRIAGLLMFGQFQAIADAFPCYMVDYQEQPESKSDVRWIDRVIPDGTWSGNLYDFYLKTIRKLSADLKVPFKLKGVVRIDDTPAHEALREALTNTIIHADYTGRVSVLITKKPDLFVFRNPGLMRISVEQATTGGVSDCRNRRIQAMFRYIGLGEHAGSGIPKIYVAWKGLHWRPPFLYEDYDNDVTLLELRTSSLLPEESLNILQSIFGASFTSLNELERIILTTAETEDAVSHRRIKELSTEHPKDITAILTRLVSDGFLIKHGETRGAYYTLAKIEPNENSLFSSSNTQTTNGNSPHIEMNSPHMGDNSPHIDEHSPHLISILDKELKMFGYQKMPRRIKPANMKRLISQLCRNHWVSVRVLGLMLDRDPKALQDRYLTEMVADGSLQLKFPKIKNHPDQAYGILE